MTAEVIRKLTERAPSFKPKSSDADLFRIVDMGELARANAIVQTWTWHGYIPVGHCTLLGGHGGAGKSTFALHLAACVAVGAEAFGQPTTKCRVAYFSGEDPASLVLFRLRRICDAVGLDLDEVQRNLQVIDAAELHPVLFTEQRFDGVRQGITTPTYSALSNYVKAERFGLVIVDNTSDTFDADEIARAQVRAFVRSLVTMVRPHGGSVLLLAHVDKATARARRDDRSTESYSGSTAWHNSARSRMLLADCGPALPGQLELKHEKCNLGRKHPPITLYWPEGGVMQYQPPPSGVVAAIEERNDTKALLKLVHEFSARGEHVPTATAGPATAARLFSSEPATKGMKSTEVADLLRRAERLGLLERESMTTASRNRREFWRLTSKGAETIHA